MAADDAPLRVAMLLDDSIERPGGVQQHVLTLARWLTRQGHEVHHLTSAPPADGGPDRDGLPGPAVVHVLAGNHTVRFNGNRLGTPGFARARAVDAALAGARPDVLHVQMPYSPLLAGRVIARAPAGCAVIGTFHVAPRGPVADAGTRALGLLQRRQVRRLGGALAVSDVAADLLRVAFGVPSQVVANPVETGRFRAARERAARAPTRPVHVLFLGRLVERKGPGHLVAAVEHLRRTGGTGAAFAVTIAGSGPLEGELRRRVAVAGLGGVVTFAGQVPEAAKADLLASADVVALPSVGGESFGISVVEALAACPGAVLAGDNPGYRTVLGADLPEALVDPRDTAGFARALARLVDDPAERAARSDRQVRLAARYDIEVVGPAVVSAYRAVLLRR